VRLEQRNGGSGDSG